MTGTVYVLLGIESYFSHPYQFRNNFGRYVEQDSITLNCPNNPNWIVYIFRDPKGFFEVRYAFKVVHHLKETDLHEKSYWAFTS